MSCKINITPRVGPNQGKSVESTLMNQIVELQPDPVLAQDAYNVIYTDDFIEKFGDWVNEPYEMLDKLDENGQPKLTIRDTDAVFLTDGEPIILKHYSKESDTTTTEDVTEKPQTEDKPGPERSDVIAGLENAKERENLSLESPNDKEYKGTSGAYERLTSVIKRLIGRDVNIERARKAAEGVFNNTRRNIETDTITVQDKELTFEQLVEYYERQFNTAAAFGKAVHKQLEYHITKDKKALVELAYIMSEKTMEKDGMVQDAISSKALRFVQNEDNANMLISRSGYVGTDKMRAEVMIHSDILGVATQVDGLYQHDDNTISLVDWKAGSAFLKDKSTIQPMPYSSEVDKFGRSRLNQAKLEVALRALIIKEQVPDAKFRSLKVHHIDRGNLTKAPYEINLNEALTVLSSFYKNTEPAKWQQLNDKGLFNYKNYKDFEAEGKNIIDKYGGHTAKNQIELIEREIQLLRNRLDTNTSVNRTKDKETIGILSAEILKLKDHTKSELDLDEVSEKESTGLGKGFLGALYNISNKHIQQYTKLFTKYRLAFLKDQRTERKEADKLFKAVQDEFYKSKGGLKGLTETLTLGTVSGYKYTDVYKFFFEYKDDKSVSIPGFYKKSLETAKKELAEGTMTQAQFNLLEYLDKTWSGTWNDVMLRTAYVDQKSGRNISYAQSIGMVDDGGKKGIVTSSGSLSQHFIPRLAQEYFEMGEQYTGLSKPFKSLYKKLKVFGIRNLTFFEEEEYYNFDQGQGSLNAVKVRYTGSNYSIAGQQHSFNLENMHYSFMTNMYQKKHMDMPLAVADGLKNFYEMKEELEGQQRFQPVISLLDRHIVGTLLEEVGYKGTADNLLSEKLTFKNPFYKGQPGQVQRVKLSVWKVLMALKNIVTAKALFLKFVGGTFNGLLITYQTITTAAAGSISKRVLRSQGLSDDAVDFSLSDLAKGTGIVAGYFRDILDPTRDKRNNKLYNLLKRFNYLPDNYDYASDKKELRMLKSPGLQYSNLFFFHAIHEEWGHSVLFAAQLKKLKMPDGSSVWDNYNDDGTWKKYKEDGSLNIRGVRKGRTEDQTEYITEITAEEALRMYKASSLIHGAYRSWERSAMETYAIGQWFLQFKKYLPAILFREWEGRHEDFNLGVHKYLMDENGNRIKEKAVIDGQEVELDVMEWHAAVHTGRVRVLAATLLASIGVKSFRNAQFHGNYNFKNLSPRDQVGAITTASGFMFTMLFMLALNSYFEDDEENPWAIRFGYLASDGLQGFNAREVLRTVKNPLAVILHLNNLSDALGQMLVSGVTGDFTKEGKLKGSKQLMKDVPFLSIQAELERYELVGKQK